MSKTIPIKKNTTKNLSRQNWAKLSSLSRWILFISRHAIPIETDRIPHSKFHFINCEAHFHEFLAVPSGLVTFSTPTQEDNSDECHNNDNLYYSTFSFESV